MTPARAIVETTALLGLAIYGNAALINGLDPSGATPYLLIIGITSIFWFSGVLIFAKAGDIKLGAAALVFTFCIAAVAQTAVAGTETLSHLLLLLNVGLAFFVFESMTTKALVCLMTIGLIAFCEFYLPVESKFFDPDQEFLNRGFSLSGLVIALAVTAFKANSIISQEAEQVDRATAKSQQLLSQLLPEAVIESLPRQSEKARRYSHCSILVADVVHFTALTERVRPAKVIEFLELIFAHFDKLAGGYNIQRIKTVGDAYMVAAGVPVARPDHAQVLADFAIEARDSFKQFKLKSGQPLGLRLGLHSGSLIGGTLKGRQTRFDLWGETVNTACHIERAGVEHQVQVSEYTYNLLKDEFNFLERGKVNVDAMGLVPLYLLRNRKTS